jgi:hypothetical protein
MFPVALAIICSKHSQATTKTTTTTISKRLTRPVVVSPHAVLTTVSGTQMG